MTPTSAPIAHAASSRWLQACGLFLCAMVALATLDMLAKDLMARHASALVNLVRYGVVLLLAVLLMVVRKVSWYVPPGSRHTLLWRGVMLGTVGLTFMQALRTMPLAEATAIYFLAPLIIVALSPWLLGEQVRRAQVIAVIAGFAGMLLIVRPGGTLPLTGTLLMLMAATAYALVQVLTRRLTGRIGMEQQFAWTAVACTVMTVLSLPLADSLAWPGAHDFAQMVLIGVLSGVGQYLLIEVFQRASASSLAPFNYFHLLLAVAFSVLVFGQRPDLLAMSGIAVISLAGLSLVLPVFRTHFSASRLSRQSSRKGLP